MNRTFDIFVRCPVCDEELKWKGEIEPRDPKTGVENILVPDIHKQKCVKGCKWTAQHIVELEEQMDSFLEAQSDAGNL